MFVRERVGNGSNFHALNYARERLQRMTTDYPTECPTCGRLPVIKGADRYAYAIDTNGHGTAAPKVGKAWRELCLILTVSPAPGYLHVLAPYVAAQSGTASRTVENLARAAIARGRLRATYATEGTSPRRRLMVSLPNASKNPRPPRT